MNSPSEILAFPAHTLPSPANVASSWTSSVLPRMFPWTSPVANISTLPVTVSPPVILSPTIIWVAVIVAWTSAPDLTITSPLTETSPSTRPCIHSPWGPQPASRLQMYDSSVPLCPSLTMFSAGVARCPYHRVSSLLAYHAAKGNDRAILYTPTDLTFHTGGGETRRYNFRVRRVD